MAAGGINLFLNGITRGIITVQVGISNISVMFLHELACFARALGHPFSGIIGKR